MELKVKTIDLFNQGLLISERTAGDVISLAEMSIDGSAQSSIYQSVIALEQGLKINIKNLKWYQLIKRYKFNRILNKKYILNNLPAATIALLALEVLKLEGLKVGEDKKKVEKKLV